MHEAASAFAAPLPAIVPKRAPLQQPKHFSPLNARLVSPPGRHVRRIRSQRVVAVPTQLPATTTTSTPTPFNLSVDESLLARLKIRAAYLGPISLHKVRSALELAEATTTSNNNNINNNTLKQFEENLHIADICAALGMDCDTVCAAVLRGLTTSIGTQLIEDYVGSSVLSILTSYDAIEQVVLRSEDTVFTEASYTHLRELVLIAAQHEHRAISIRLASSLVNSRALGTHVDIGERTLLARRAMYLDAPLANQLGMWYLQNELEESAFKHLQPRAYQSTKNSLAERLRQSGNILADTKNEIESVLHKAKGVRAVVSRARVVGRVKGAYSVHTKMQRQGKQHIDQVYDLLALRVIIAPKKGGGDFDECSACYACAEAIRHHYPVLEGREKDYLKEPKSNGYRSLHLTVLAGEGLQPLEVQIRTEKMHHVAEFGAAAHWLYKDPSPGTSEIQDQKRGPKMFQALEERTRQDGLPYPRPRIPPALGPAAEADAKRSGYVSALAEVIRASRVIVKSAGQLYTLKVGATLADLCCGLGMVTFGVVAVVNGQVAPLTQELAMNDIVRFSVTMNA